MKKSQVLETGLLAFGVSALLAVTVCASPFSKGNLIVARGLAVTNTVSNTLTEVLLDEITPEGNTVQTFALPSVASGANKALTLPRNSHYLGKLARSADDRFITLGGYAGASGSRGESSPGATLGRVRFDGQTDTSTFLAAPAGFSSASVPYSVVSDNGSRFWSAYPSYLALRLTQRGATTDTQLTSNGFLALGIFGGQLFGTTSIGPSPYKKGVARLGSGLPTSAPTEVTLLPGFNSDTPYPGDFYPTNLQGGTRFKTVYLVSGSPDKIQKWSRVNEVWKLDGSVAISNPYAAHLTGKTVGSTATLYFTTVTGLYRLTDTGGFNAPINGTSQLVASAPAGYSFYGVALAPKAPATSAREEETAPSGQKF